MLIKGSSQQSWTSDRKGKGGGPLYSGQGPLITGRLVNDATPAMDSDNLIQFSLPSKIRQSYLFIKRLY